MQDEESRDHELGFTIKVINNLTGEVSEIEIKSASRAAEVYAELKASRSAIEKALRTITARLDDWLGEDEESPLPNGMVVRRVHRQRSEWSFEHLRSFLDEDQITLVAAVKKTQAKEMLGELIEAGHVSSNAIKEMDEHAIPLPSSPFIEVRQ